MRRVIIIFSKILKQCPRGTKSALAHGVGKKKNQPLEIADWAKAEQRKQMLKEWRIELFARVRVVFILLLLAAILVFMSNRQDEVEHFVSAKIQLVAKKLPGSDRLRASALKHESEIDAINEPANQPAAQQPRS
jgi:hypothetical protein